MFKQKMTSDKLEFLEYLNKYIYSNVKSPIINKNFKSSLKKISKVIKKTNTDDMYAIIEMISEYSDALKEDISDHQIAYLVKNSLKNNKIEIQKFCQKIIDNRKDVVDNRKDKQLENSHQQIGRTNNNLPNNQECELEPLEKIGEISFICKDMRMYIDGGKIYIDRTLFDHSRASILDVSRQYDSPRPNKTTNDEVKIIIGTYKNDKLMMCYTGNTELDLFESFTFRLSDSGEYAYMDSNDVINFHIYTDYKFINDGCYKFKCYRHLEKYIDFLIGEKINDKIALTIN